MLANLFIAFRIASVSETSIHEALDLNWDDFEDCVQYTVGKSVNVDYIITRNTRDFAKSEIKTMTPEDFLMTVISLNA